MDDGRKVAAARASQAIAACLSEGLCAADLSANCVQLVPTRDRDAVGQMLEMTEDIDVIVPRGGKSLTERVSQQSKVPVLKHLDGICHTYIDENYNPLMAKKIVFNAKMRRTGICGATETLLVSKKVTNLHVSEIIDILISAGCEIRGDNFIKKIDGRVKKANFKDWQTEYLAPIISIKSVKNVEEAIEHINQYGSNHTDAIITSNKKNAELFLNSVDSSIVMHNTSTQFADGGEFGMGAEIGISTGKLHARGPVGADQLTTFKYVVKGKGQLRS